MVPSTMVGRKNGVATKLKEINPFLTSMHCIAHRLHLAGRDAANEVQYFKDYEATCKELYSYFNGSYINSIIDALNFDKMNANDQRDRNRAAKILELLDSKFKLSTIYMADLTYILSILCKTFQKDNISLSEVKYSLDIAIAAITTQFIGIDDQLPTYG
ncbi:unnamed protein product [Rhizophagus irregularis]|nr:unnamed protein product [Rhizophagus irregularis]